MTGTLTVSSKQLPFPFAAIAIAAYTGKAVLVFDETATGTALVLNGTTITEEEDIVQVLAKDGGLVGDSAKVEFSHILTQSLFRSDVSSQAQSFFALSKTLRTVSAFPETVAALDSLDDYLTFRTFLVGHSITAADWIVWGTLKGSSVMITYNV